MLSHRSFAVTLAIGWLVLVVVLSLIVQWLPISRYGVSVGPPNTAPHWGQELLGTDAAGRSMLARLVYGARTSLTISIVATVIAFTIGTLIGILAAYFRGPVAVLGETVANTLLAIPTLVLLIGILLPLGSSVPAIMFVCGVAYVPQYIRLARAEAARQLQSNYILAARSLGIRTWRIIVRELLPNTIPTLVAFTVLVISSVMIVEGGLSFLGYGVQSPTPSWGNMIAFGNDYLTVMPWGSLLPCFAFGLTVLSMILVGDHLRDRFSITAMAGK